MEPEDVLVTVGTNIKRARKKAGMSQREFAAATGMQKASISRMESGKTNLTLKTICNIAATLQLKIADLFQ